MFSERTLYKIIDAGCLSVKNIDLPTKVRRRVRHSKPTCKVDTKCRQGRTFDDFKSFIDEYPDTAIVQMDTVIGRKGGKVLLTLHLVNCSFMLAFIRDYNDSRSVIDIFNHLYNLLGADTFKQLFPIILTDNGSEFSNPSELELSGEDKRTRIFYCDPSAPYQKGACEVNHEFIRKFTPKGKSIDDWNQDKVNKMMSHINGYGRKKLNGKSPADLFIELYGETVFNQLGLQRLLPDEIHLSKQLFKEDSN